MRTPIGIFITLLVCTAGVFAFSPRTTLPLAPTQIPTDNMLLTSTAETEAGLIVAGELGSILVSQDGGESWQKAALSTQRHALITQLRFTDDQYGLAIGHEGWILRTTDGGLSWDEVAFDEERGEPLLDLARLPSGNWVAVGAFGRVLSSDDLGLNWQPMEIPGNTDWHLNSISGSADGRHWLIVGETGTAFRSADSGENWKKVPEFYEGSLYGVASLGDDTWVAYGMRGNIFRSADNGETWHGVPFDRHLSLFTHKRLPDGTFLLGGQDGVVLASEDQGHTFDIIRRGNNGTLTDLGLSSTGEWLLLSNAGLLRIVAKEKQPSHSNALLLLDQSKEAS